MGIHHHPQVSCSWQSNGIFISVPNVPLLTSHFVCIFFCNPISLWPLLEYMADNLVALIWISPAAFYSAGVGRFLMCGRSSDWAASSEPLIHCCIHSISAPIRCVCDSVPGLKHVYDTDYAVTASNDSMRAPRVLSRFLAGCCKKSDQTRLCPSAVLFSGFLCFFWICFLFFFL